MLQQDFLMRAIQNLTAAFARLVRMRGDSPEQARVEIEDLLAEQLGTRRELLFAQTLDVLERVEPGLAAYYGKYFALHAAISRELGSVEDARESLMWARGAYARGLSGTENEGTKEAESGLTELLRTELVEEMLRVDEVRASYLLLYDFGERHQRLPEAEDALFAALELGAGEELRQRAIRFFESVAKRGDLYYEEHGLSAREVAAVVRELRGDLED